MGSFLDPLLTGEPANLAPLEASIALLQTADAAQQTQLDEIAAELEGFGDAQAAIDAIQSAAITAAELVNTTQTAAQAALQAAQDANAALDVTQAGAIVTLQGTVGSNTAAIAALQTLTGTQAAQIASLVANAQPMIEVDLRRFVSGGVLTNANIDDAIDAAIIAAMGATGPGFRGPAPVITCPPGIWTLTRPHVFAGFPGDANRCFIGFRGAGMNETVFLANTDGTGTPVFTFGNASTPGVNPWIMYLFVSGFSIIAGVDENTVRTGVRIYCAVNPLITSVRVRGLNSANAQYDQGRGIEILPALGAGVEINSQFVVLKDCDLSVNMTGLYVRRSYPILIDNCHIQANHFEDAIFDGCLGEWRNSGAQFQGDSSLYPDRWYGRRNMPGIVTGFSKTTGLAAGTGASCAAAVGNLSLVTLPGATLSTMIDRGRWVRLTPGGASANEIKVRGMYKIDSVASPTTAWIRKGSNHTLQTGLAYQVCESEPGSEMTFDHLYDEAVSRVACYGFYRDSAGTGVFVVKRPQAFIHGGYVFESDGPYRVRLEAPPVANVEKLARVRMTKESFVDATPDKIECDDYSHPGHASRSAWQKPFTGLIPSDARIAYAYRDSGGGSAVRLRTALQEMGFLEIWDARVTSSINIVGADARSWTGLLKGTVLGPTTGALYPLYTPDDPLFGGPCVTMVAGTHLTGRSFKGAIAAANLPTTPYLCTIFTVARLEGVSSPGSELCRVQVGTADANQFIAFNDGLWTGGVYGMNEGTTVGNALTAFTPAVNTDPHAYVFGRSPDGTNVISTDHGEDYRMHNAHAGGFAASHTPGANLDVVVGGVGATYSHRAFRVAAVAVKVGTHSHAEARKLIDLARNEWPLEP